MWMSESLKENRYKNTLFIAWKNSTAHQEDCLNLFFSKFALLWPKLRVLANATESQPVRLWPIHQNFKLIAKAVLLKHLVRKLGTVFQNYKDVFNLTVSRSGILQKSCRLKMFLIKIRLFFEYKKLITTDHCNLKTITALAREFITGFIGRIFNLLRYLFVVSQKSFFFQKRQENLAAKWRSWFY